MVENLNNEEQWEDVKRRKKKGDLTNGYEEEPDFSDPEDFVDDVSDSGTNFLLIQWEHQFSAKLKS